MARRGDNRSPSPAGSSRRNGRRDDARPRDRRDEGRLSYRRSRSPVDRARYRDRDSHRDNYARHDRRDGDYRSARRDRSRDRYRSPRSPDRLSTRDRRDRSRDRAGPRDRRDDSRDRHRRRADDASDSRHPSAGRGGPARTPSSAGRESPKQSSAGKQSEEDKKAERLARMQAWKEKQKLKEQEPAAGAARKILDDMGGPPTTFSDTASPRSPATPATPQEPASPAPYAGKFDPKAIAKRAAANASGSSGALGDDLPLPKKLKSSVGTTSNLSNGSSQPAHPVQSTAPGPLKGKAHVSGFGLGAKAAAETAASKRALDFGEEEGTRKKLERLPTPPPEDAQVEDAAPTAVEEQDPIDDHDDDDTGSENGEAEAGGAAAAARAAAEERRDERLRAESQARQEADGDAKMADAAPQDDEDEVDPLDAFMSGLADPSTTDAAPGLSTASTGTGTLQAPEAYFSDDEDELTAIKGGSGDVLEMAALKAAAARRKKDIPKVDHSKMEYEPFQKSFYHEPSELAKMTEEELADLRLELDGIKVRGVDVPKPVRSWAQCGLGVASLDVIRKLGYEAPTSIQSQALPVIMSGRDVIGVAKTGSGKTMAFLLPMFRHIKAQRPSEGLDGPIGLVLAPTRELATQIHKDCRPWLKALGLRAVCAYGGAPIKEQIAELKRGAEIVVATAGRLIDLLAANGGRVTNLRRVTYVVLDEADRMFDMGFEPQIMKIMGNIRPERQTVLFSATFPRNMEALARKTLQKPVEIIVGGRSVVAPEITQIVEVRPENSKFLRLLQLLGEVHEDEDARSLIFVDRQESAEDLMNAILKRGYPCFTIHGGKDQFDRDTVIADFKAGIFPVMVATSVAARGLDVKQLKMVVNFDCPNHLEDYVHRAGRTGRAGQKGLAVTFITEEQGRFSLDIAKALRQSGQEVPEALQKLGDEFMEKVKAGKEKAFSGTGFGGKGLDRLEADRDAARLRERGLYKTGDEPEENEEKAKAKDAKEKKDDIVVHSLKEAKAAAAAAAAEPPKPVAPKPSASGAPVIDLDAKINVIKKEAAEPTANRMATVSEKVAAINARLRKNGDIRGNAPIDNKGPDAGEYHATLEINDFPQKARWACTNRTNVAKILAETGTSITTKGEFYAPGRPPPGPTDPPKLYILVEGDTEISVINAMKELQRSLHDAMAAVIESEARAPVSGRYSVV